MTLRYRVIVVRAADERFEAYVRAFPSLRVFGGTVRETVDAARAQIATLLKSYAESGRRPPAPDRDAVAVELVELPFEAGEHGRPNVQIEIVTGKISKDGGDLPMRGASLELLVALAAEGREVSVDVLCERLYPGLPREQAYGALKMCVYRARKHLSAPGAIGTTERGYRLAEDIVVDTRFLPQIVRAIRTRSVAKAIEARLESIFEQLVRGRPAAYESWEWFVPFERDLCNAAREIGLDLANRALREGAPDRALEIARALAALDPLDETAYELEIRVHLARGDRASALQTYRRYAGDLQEKHGMEPSPALRLLVD
ncbi:MAG TPA: BTAD domain-containing putative transcriptional regulator [Candidatus Baltobacteraceae bacterium]|nr:BTAD domain-containing putative transcriptional regulator [Candidatus Baltobacteraceae bacterium]